MTRDFGNPAAAPPVIDLAGLSVRFGRQQVLDDLRCSLSGRAIGLLGPNGAGKTTLLNTLLGFYRPTSGAARLFGMDVVRQGRDLRQRVGYMPERDAFIAGVSGVRFVRMMGELSGLPPEAALERAHEVFFYVGLGEARYRDVETYSLGMKQLLKLAQAIVHGPSLLFLDEPTNGLDPPARVRMLRLIREIRDAGETTVVVSSHLLRDVEECCEEVLVLNRGRIATWCNLAEERRGNRRFLELDLGAEREGAGSAFRGAIEGLGCEVAVVNRRRIKAVLPPGVEVRHIYASALEQDVTIRRLDYKRTSLEDIFLQAMEGDDGRL